MPGITPDLIRDTYNTSAAGRDKDAVSMGQGVGNPWLVNIVKSYQNTFGRLPTTAEVEQATPAFQQAGGHGEAFISSLYQQDQNTPANIYSKQQQQWQQNAPQNYGTVGTMVKSLLGRDATQDELSHYGTLIASGQADPFQIQQFIQATPEYQNAQDTTFRQGVDTQLQKSDTDFFNTQKGNIAQQYALMGRSTSPALDVALTQLASQLNSQRGQYLAQLSASQYGNNKANAVAGYNNTQQQVQGQIAQNTGGIYGNFQNNQNRVQQLGDYNSQAAQYASALNHQNQPSWMDYLNSGLNTANTGAKVYSAYKGNA